MPVLTEAERRIVRALGQAMFPREAQGLPDGMESGLVDYVDDLLARSLPFERAQLRAMFQAWDRGFGVWSGNPLGRLVTAPAEEVSDYLRSWEESPLYERRMLFEALRSVLLMGWFGSPKVQAEVGVSAPEDVDAPMAWVARTLEAAGLPAPPPPPPIRADLFLDRPEGLFEIQDYKGDLRESCDVLVVGSGPGGAIMALRLAERGLRVILVEAGPVARKPDLDRDGGHTMARLLWDSGMRTTSGGVIAPTMQARVLGGGSLINSAICLRASEGALSTWAEEHGLDELTAEALEPHYQAVEAFMGVREVDPRVQGPRNDLFALACERLGMKATPIRRNEAGCLGSGGCLYGCRNGAKLSHDRRGVPELLALGGRVYTSVHAERLLLHGGRCVGIEGRIEAPGTLEPRGRVRITAKATVLAGGVIGTPILCQKSGLSHPGIGANLRLHPSTVVAGDLDRPVLPWTGAAQGMHCLDLLDYGIKLESLWADPALMAFRMPSMGKALKRQLARYDKMAIWDAWVSGDDSVGAVRHIPGAPRPSIRFDFGAADVRRLQQATATLAEMLFAVGAVRVYPGIHGLPQVLESPAGLAELRNAKVGPQDLPIGSNHVFGTMAMGRDPARHPCEPDGRVRGVDGLFVSDTSLLPSSPGANPMLIVWALADRNAAAVAGSVR